MLKLKYVFVGFVLFACYKSYMSLSLLNERTEKNSKVSHNDRNLIKESAEVAYTSASAHLHSTTCKITKAGNTSGSKFTCLVLFIRFWQEEAVIQSFICCPASAL